MASLSGGSAHTWPFRVGTSEGKGRGVFAASDLVPGDTVLIERPVVTWKVTQPEANTKADKIAQCIQGLKLSIDTSTVWDLGQQLAQLDDISPEQFEFLLTEFYCPELTMNHASIRRIRALVAQLLKKNIVNIPYTKVSEVTRYLLIANANSFTYLFNDAALFVDGAMFNHSCKPNVSYRSYKGKAYFRAVEPIAKGEEMFISYLGDTKLCQSTVSRRRYLVGSKFFQCQCSRCLSPDTVRQMLCPNTNCSGQILRYPSPLGGDDEVSEHFWSCSVCESTFPDKKVPLVMERDLEELYQDIALNMVRKDQLKVQTLKERFDKGVTLIRKASQDLGPSHWIAGLTHRLVSEACFTISILLGHSKSILQAGADQCIHHLEWHQKHIGNACRTSISTYVTFAFTLFRSLDQPKNIMTYVQPFQQLVLAESDPIEDTLSRDLVEYIEVYAKTGQAPVQTATQGSAPKSSAQPIGTSTNTGTNNSSTSSSPSNSTSNSTTTTSGGRAPCHNPHCTQGPGVHADKICSQCRVTRYCSKECQRSDWKAHKKECKKKKTAL